MGVPEALGVEASRTAWQALTSPRSDGPELTAVVLSHLSLVNAWFHDDSQAMLAKYGSTELPIGALAAFRIFLANTGSEPLVGEKFQRPIEIELPKKAHLQRLTLKWRRHNTLHPDDDPIDIDDEGRTIRIQPELFNQGDALIVSGITAGPLSAEPRISVRYPNLPKIESIHLRASDAVTFDNLNIEARKVAWPWLRKFSPKRFDYRRAAQLHDAVQILLDWEESK